MAWRVGWARTSALVLAVVLAACSGDDAAPPVTYDGGRDAGRRDGGGDGGGMDASVDGGGTDGGSSDAGPADCVFDAGSDLLALGSDPAGKRRVVALAPATSGFLAVWSARTGGIERVLARRVPSAGAPGPVRTVSDEASFSSALAPAVTRDGDGGFVVAWYDNSTGGYEVHAQRVDGSGAPQGESHRLTMNDARDDNPALLFGGSELVGAWVQDTTEGRVARTRVLGTDGSPSAGSMAATAPPAQPSTIVLSSLEGGYALAWADTLGSESQLSLQPLDGDAAPAGEPHRLDSEGNPDGTFDLATTGLGGAAVFGVRVGGVRPEVRLRFLDESGTPSGAEQVLTAGGERETDPSVALFRGGFAVATRLLEGGDGIATPAVRLQLFDDTAEPVESFELTTASEAGGRTTTAAALDGTALLVAWAEQGESETALRAARVRCGAGPAPADGGVPSDAGLDAGGEDAGGGPVPLDAAGLPEGGLPGFDGSFGS